MDVMRKQHADDGYQQPSIGIPRLSRWRRAYALDMEPPMEVLAVLLKEEKDKGMGVSGRSIMDDLILSSKVEA